MLISMLSPSKWVLTKYKAMVVKMVIYSPTINVAKKNYELFCDVETLLGLACLLPLLEPM
jgi:hypothetical protein